MDILATLEGGCLSYSVAEKYTHTQLWELPNFFFLVLWFFSVGASTNSYKLSTFQFWYINFTSMVTVIHLEFFLYFNTVNLTVKAEVNQEKLYILYKSNLNSLDVLCWSKNGTSQWCTLECYSMKMVKHNLLQIAFHFLHLT